MTEPQRIELQKTEPQRTEPQRIEPQKSEVGISEDRQGMTLRLGSGQAEDGRQPPSLKLRRAKDDRWHKAENSFIQLVAHRVILLFHTF
jgi:hypothetical protein